ENGAAATCHLGALPRDTAAASRALDRDDDLAAARPPRHTAIARDAAAGDRVRSLTRQAEVQPVPAPETRVAAVAAGEARASGRVGHNDKRLLRQSIMARRARQD